MAGGKETPRQKMIGMMYLVLTALLALNVSKQILDAFVAIEENTQKGNIAQVERGDDFKNKIKEEITTTKSPDQKPKLEKLKKVMAKMEEVDKVTAEIIKQIDELKIEILKESGEKVDTYKNEDEESILWVKGEGCTPARMHLMAVQAKDQYDVPMHVIVGEDIKNPTGKGKKLWDDYNAYRLKLVEMLGSYSEGGKAFSIKPKAINTFTNNKDLNAQVDKMILSSKANIKRDAKGKVIGLGEDGQVLKDIYINLTKPERVKQHELDGVHWIGMTFDHSPLVAAVASLSSMQQDILQARAMALAHLKSKVSTGEYSFNKIMPLAYGPSIANTGDEAEILVMMAAFDSDNQPTVTGGGPAVVKDGQARIKVKVSGGAEMPLSGTITIKNKAGVPKTENWNWNIKIMKPQGTVSLPDMNVLYRGYDNRIEGVASGYDQTILNGNGVTLTKTGTGWIGKPGAGKEATISISGKNSVTNKTVSLGSYKFRVRNLPKPSLYFGGAEDGGQASKAETRLFAKYGPEIPLNVTFSVLSWELNVSGAPRPAKGTGSTLSGEGVNFLKQAKPGSMISFMTQVKGPDGVVRKVGGSFRI